LVKRRYGPTGQTLRREGILKTEIEGRTEGRKAGEGLDLRTYNKLRRM